MANPIKTVLRHHVESKIKKNVRKGDLDNVRMWLNIAKETVAGQNAEENQNPEMPLQFSFKDGTTLTEYAIEKSNYLLRRYHNYPTKSPWHYRLRVFFGFTTPEKLYLFPSQRYIQQLFLLESENLKPLPKRGLWTRFKAWNSKKLAIPFDFTAEAIEVKTVAGKFYQNGVLQVEGSVTPSKVRKVNAPTRANTLEENSLSVSISEHYTNTEILNNPKLIKKRLGMNIPPREFAVKMPKKAAPHLAHLIKDSKITQVLAVDQLNQHLQQQKLNLDLDIKEDNLLAPVQLQTEQFTDNSAQSPLNTFVKSLDRKAVIQWLENFEKECKKVHRLKHPNFKISQTAQDILSRDEAFPFYYQEDIDLNELPLGFFIDKENNAFVLKFSQEYRQKQLKNPLNNLRLDLASFILNKEEIEIVEVFEEESLEILEKKFYEELDQKNINPSPLTLETILKCANHKAPKDVCSNSGSAERRYNTLLPSIYKQLRHILSDAGPQYFLSLLIQLEKMSHIQSKQFSQWSLAYKYGFKQKKCSLLDHFLGAYFPDNKPIADTIGKELCQTDALKMLNNLTAPNNALAQRLFAAIISAEDTVSFNKAYHAAMVAQDHFKSLNINVTNALLKSIAASSFKSLANMINLSSHATLPALQMQLALADKIPHNTVFCTRLLEQGYSFVVQCMDLSRYSDFVKGSFDSFKYHTLKHWTTDSVPLIVDDEFLEMTSKFPVILNDENTYHQTLNPYFIAWFRYLAFQVHPNYVEEAIKKWQDLMGEDSLVIVDENFERDKKNLEKNWIKLVQHAIELPKKMTIKEISPKQIGYAKQEKNTGFINEQLAEEAIQITKAVQTYSIEKATELCGARLKIQDEETKYILEALEELNAVGNIYKNLSQNQIKTEISNIKDSVIKDCFEQQIQALALLREINYRFTLATSKSIPRRGEWLRMEQAIAVLLTLKAPGKLLQIDTSEGKTLIICLSALMQALIGYKTNIYTHNEIFADEYINKLLYLTQIFGLRLADKKSDKDNQLDADIFCIDISSAVIQQTLERYMGITPRKAQIDLADEIDNQLDIQANTTMQISEKNNENFDQQKFEEILITMCQAYLDLKEKPELVNLEDQIAFIKNALVKLSASEEPDKIYLKFWLAKIANADQKKLNTDYIIDEEGRIRIVHHKTTGRVDRESIWGEFFHQCVGALEKLRNPHRTIVIEPLSTVVAEGSIARFYKNSGALRYAFTATLGDSAFSQKISEVLNTEEVIIMPRAERPDLEEAHWPLITDGRGNYHKQYNRSYRFAPIICKNNTVHFETLIDMICEVREQNQSAIVFFNTIEECEEFYRILQEAGVYGPVQIFDDTNLSDEDNDNATLKKSQKASMLHASAPQMITLTTAAGSRGVDFNSVSVGIIATPSLARVVDQKAGRIGRNAQFGIVYEVYSWQNLDASTQTFLTEGEAKPVLETEQVIDSEEIDDSEEVDEKANLRTGLDSMELAMQEQELNQLISREPLDDFKDKVQLEYSMLNYKSPTWGPFFASIQTGSNIEELENTWNKFKQRIEEERGSYTLIN